MAISEAKKVLMIKLVSKDQITKGTKAAIKGLKLLKKTGVATMKSLAFAAKLPLKAFVTLTNPINALRAALVALPFAAIVNEASEAQQVLNSYKFVFQDQADAASAWAEETSEAINRSEITIKRGLTTFQTFFRGLDIEGEDARELSQIITELTFDIASFFPQVKNTDEALQKLLSGISGEMKPLKDLGIILSEAAVDQELLAQGVKGGSDSASEQQKAIARLIVVYKALQSQNALGSVIAKSNQYKNSTDELKDSIKDVSIALGDPFLGPLAAASRELASFLRDNKDDVNQFSKDLVHELVVLGLQADAFRKAVRDLLSDPAEAETLGKLMEIAGDLAVDAFKETLIAGVRVAGNVLTLAARPLLRAAEVLGSQMGKRIRDGILGIGTPSEQLDSLRQQRDAIIAEMARLEDLPGIGAGIEIQALSRDLAVIETKILEVQDKIEEGIISAQQHVGEGFQKLVADIRKDAGDIEAAISDAKAEIAIDIAEAKVELEALAKTSPIIERLVAELGGVEEAATKLVSGLDKVGEAAVDSGADIETASNMLQKYASTAALTEAELRRLRRAQEDLNDMLVEAELALGAADLAFLEGRERRVAELKFSHKEHLTLLRENLRDQRADLRQWFAEGLIDEEQHAEAKIAVWKAYIASVQAENAEHLRAMRQETGSFFDGFEDAAKNSLDELSHAYAAGEEAFGEVFGEFRSGLRGMVDDAVDGTLVISEAFEEMGISIIKTLLKIAAEQAAIAIVKGLFPGFTGFTTGVPAVAPSAKGNVFNHGDIVPFAQGGVIRRPVIFPLAKGGIGLAGERGPEAIMPLERDRSGRLGVRASGDGPQNVSVTFEINTIDARGFDELLAQRKGVIKDLVIDAINRNRDMRRQVGRGA